MVAPEASRPARHRVLPPAPRPDVRDGEDRTHPKRARPARPGRPARVGAGEGAAAGALDHYLRDIGGYPLITREQEAELARRIRAGDQDALDALVRANLRFVVSVAKRYQHQGVPLDDLVAEGNLGLIRAAHKFDETREIKFISFAVWWIRQAVHQALADQSRIVCLPLSRTRALYHVGRRANTLLQELGREATHAEIAAGTEFTEAEVAEALALRHPARSLDAPLGDGEDTGLLDYLADEHSAAPEEQALARALAEALTESLATLKAREARILRLYFGLDGEPMTLEAISAGLGVSRERVRQLKEQALWRLRHAARAQSLAGFLG
jgi:RNA polymerase primary sigma factor